MALIAVIEKFRHTNLHIKLCLIVSIPDSVSQTLSFSLFSVLYLVQKSYSSPVTAVVLSEIRIGRLYVLHRPWRDKKNGLYLF